MKRALKEESPYTISLVFKGVFDGSDGVLRFKQNFNGYIVRKMGTFRYYPNPLKYKSLVLDQTNLRTLITQKPALLAGLFKIKKTEISRFIYFRLVNEVQQCQEAFWIK